MMLTTHVTMAVDNGGGQRSGVGADEAGEKQLFVDLVVYLPLFLFVAFVIC